MILVVGAAALQSALKIIGHWPAVVLIKLINIFSKKPINQGVLP
jgi:hypothetical protein